MRGEILRTSFCVSLVRLVDGWVRNSVLYGTCLLVKGSVVGFGENIFKKIDAIQLPPDTIHYSKFVQFLIAFYHSAKGKVQRYSKTSAVVAEANSFKKEFNASPVEAIGIILVSAIGINVILSFLLRKPIDPWGWFIRVLFLILGIGAIFCRANLATLKRNSFFLRKYRKVENV